MGFQVACDEDFVSQIGRDVFFDLVDHEKVRSFRVQKLMPFNVFKVCRHWQIPHYIYFCNILAVVSLY